MTFRSCVSSKCDQAENGEDVLGRQKSWIPACFGGCSLLLESKFRRSSLSRQAMPWREMEEKKEEEEEEKVGSPGGKLEISEARSRLRIYEDAVPGKRVQKWEEEEEEAKEWRMDQVLSPSFAV